MTRRNASPESTGVCGMMFGSWRCSMNDAAYVVVDGDQPVAYPRLPVASGCGVWPQQAGVAFVAKCLCDKGAGGSMPRSHATSSSSSAKSNSVSTLYGSHSLSHEGHQLALCVSISSANSLGHSSQM